MGNVHTRILYIDFLGINPSIDQTDVIKFIVQKVQQHEFYTVKFINYSHTAVNMQQLIGLLPDKQQSINTIISMFSNHTEQKKVFEFKKGV